MTHVLSWSFFSLSLLLLLTLKNTTGIVQTHIPRSQSRDSPPPSPQPFVPSFFIASVLHQFFPSSTRVESGLPYTPTLRALSIQFNAFFTVIFAKKFFITITTVGSDLTESINSINTITTIDTITSTVRGYH